MLSRASPLADLSPRNRQLALMLAEGMPWNAATFVAAGFSKRSASVRAAEYRHNANSRFVRFREAVRFAIDTRLLHLAPLAVSALEKELTTGGKDRIKAAVELLNRSGWPASRELTINHQHSIENLSVDQLRARLATLWRDLSATERQQLSGMGVTIPVAAIDAEFTSVAPEDAALPVPAANAPQPASAMPDAAVGGTPSTLSQEDTQ